MCDNLRESGSEHYKTDGVEPIDLIEELEGEDQFHRGNIIKYAFRDTTIEDFEKIIWYARRIIRNRSKNKEV